VNSIKAKKVFTGIVLEWPWFCKMISWFMSVGGITLCPFIIVRDKFSYRLITHEMIHIRQYLELWVVGFWPVYLWDWFRGLIKYKSFTTAYENIRLEQEAYDCTQYGRSYLVDRKKFAWRKYNV